MTPEIRLELQQLLSALCDGAITESEQQRLEQLLDADPDSRREYLEYLDMHARLLVHPGLGAAVSTENNSNGEASGNEPAAAPLSSRSSARKRGRAELVFRYAIAVVTTLVVSFVVQAVWWQTHQPVRAPEMGGRRPITGPTGRIDTAGPAYVATLVQTAGCTWEDGRGPRRSGSRLRSGKLRLEKGLARIRFDAGSELLVEGPADLHLDSTTSATLVSGKAVFHSDETAAPFDLHTPSATLMDYGTEYAVLVDHEGEEVQVFEGEVQRTPRLEVLGVEPQFIKAGEAFRSGPNGSFAGRSAPLNPDRFKRQMTDPDMPGPDPMGGLLAHEGFEYKNALAMRNGQANGGFGWASPWTTTMAIPAEGPNALRGSLNIEESLDRPDAPLSSVGGHFQYTGVAVFYRRLATPIRLDTDGVYYISCLFRRSGPAGHPHNVVGLLLRPDEPPHKRPDLSNRLSIGAGGSNQIFAHFGRECAHASVPLTGATYLMVIKIVASSTAPEQVFVRVYAPREPLGPDEPFSWTVISPPFHTKLVFEWLGVYVNSKHRQMIDEIRVGTTWSSVTAPWMAPRGNGNDSRN